MLHFVMYRFNISVVMYGIVSLYGNLSRLPIFVCLLFERLTMGTDLAKLTEDLHHLRAVVYISKPISCSLFMQRLSYLKTWVGRRDEKLVSDSPEEIFSLTASAEVLLLEAGQ